VILATQEAEIRRSEVQSQPKQVVLDTHLENTPHKKRAGGVDQVVQCLPTKLEALSSNPSTTKKKKKVNALTHPCTLGLYTKEIPR
jgi:hypothetical protein